MPTLEERVAACLIGTAVGDSIGLPREGLTASRAHKIFGGEVHHSFLFGRGMVSDDTEHAAMTVIAFIQSSGDVKHFQRSLGRELAQWLISAPAGIGFATLKSCLKLCIGIPASKSGVRSAGNGPAMRAPVLAVLIEDWQKLIQYVDASSRVTHTDIQAVEGARLLAMVTRLLIEGHPQPLEEAIRFVHLSDSWTEALESLRVAKSLSTERFARELVGGDRVSGYILHTVPVVLHAVLRNGPDYGGAIRSLIHCGGDTDTTAAIAGGMIAAAHGQDVIPEAWRDGIRDWPYSLRSLRAHSTMRASLPQFLRHPLPLRWARNALFFAVVLGHAVRRTF